MGYLISQNLLDHDFVPSCSVNMILPMRLDERILIHQIQHLLKSGYFDILCQCRNEDSVELRALDIFLVLSHFIHVIYIQEEQADLMQAYPRKKSIVLPEMETDLADYITSDNMHQKNFTMIKDDQKQSKFLSKSLPSAFSFYNVNLAKNSYLYEFYQNANINEIDEYNNVDDNKLWYAMKASRQLLTALCNNIQPDGNSRVKESFKYCLNRVTECFFKITN